MWWEQSGALHPAVGQTRKLQVFFFLFLLMFPFCSSLSFSGRVAESRWSTCIVCSLPALLQVVQMVVKLHLPSHHLWAFWVIDKWCFYCGSSATDAKNISGVRSL